MTVQRFYSQWVGGGWSGRWQILPFKPNSKLHRTKFLSWRWWWKGAARLHRRSIFLNIKRALISSYEHHRSQNFVRRSSSNLAKLIAYFFAMPSLLAKKIPWKLFFEKFRWAEWPFHPSFVNERATWFWFVPLYKRLWEAENLPRTRSTRSRPSIEWWRI